MLHVQPEHTAALHFAIVSLEGLAEQVTKPQTQQLISNHAARLSELYHNLAAEDPPCDLITYHCEDIL
jgi:hypothetical protein